MTTEERFWSKVDQTGDCWEWTASKTIGYGRFSIAGRRPVAHRVAYELLVGPIPSDREIHHVCVNRGCVNPAHMELVTHAENCQRTARGRTHGFSYYATGCRCDICRDAWRDYHHAHLAKARKRLGPCSFPDCDEGQYARGLCKAHYQQQRDGRPLSPYKRRPGARKPVPA